MQLEDRRIAIGRPVDEVTTVAPPVSAGDIGNVLSVALLRRLPSCAWMASHAGVRETCT